MFVNLASESREQLLSLVQTMHLSESDVIGLLPESWSSRYESL